jgi:hypothetical protein
MLNIDCFVRTAPVIMDVNYGCLTRVTYLTFVRRGAEASVQSGIYRMPRIVICCLLFVNAYLSLMNFVVVQSTLCAHACRMSPNSLVRSHHMVCTLLAAIHQWVRTYCFVPTDIKLISTIFLVALLIILFFLIIIAQ